MQALYLSPATGEDLAVSLEKPVPLELVQEHFGPKFHEELRARLGSQAGVYCWAMSRVDERTVPSGYEKMQEGDIVLFKRSGTPVTSTFDYCGEVICKRPSRDFGREVWPQGENWHFVYFFKSIEKIRIDKEKLFAAIGYVRGGALQGQKRVAEDKVRGIHERYGTLDAFLAALKSATPVAPIVDDGGPIDEPEPGPPALPVGPTGQRPDWLASVIDDVKSLFRRHERKLKGHEVLVARFYEALGFSNVDGIRFRAGHLDVVIEGDDAPLIVNVVKRDKNVSCRQSNVRREAYKYALENEAPIVVVTNGDYYAFLDRRKGPKWTQHLERELTLSRLTPEDVLYLESRPWLKPAG